MKYKRDLLRYYALYVLRRTFWKQDVHKVDIVLRYDNYDKQDGHMYVFDCTDNYIMEVEYHIQKVVEGQFDHNDMLIPHKY